MKEIILPDFYTPDPDDIAIAIDPELAYDDAVVNVPLYPDLTQDEIDALFTDDNNNQ